MPHIPVMAGEWVKLVCPTSTHILLDLTVGAGGHAGAFLAASAPTGRVIGCDRDLDALEEAQEALSSEGGRVEFRHEDFLTALSRLQKEAIRPDTILMDLGVSSMQLDRQERGFSLREDDILDMRMDQSRGRTASDFLNHSPSEDIEHALCEWGGEPRGRRVAEAIVRRRKERPFRTTGDLRCLIEEVLRRRGGRVHPATRTFQGIRIAVNDEMNQLMKALPQAVALLPLGGTLAVIAFHSGEDRIVKDFMEAAEQQGEQLLTKRAVVSGARERRVNRRSRSARLRVLMRRSEGAEL